MSTQTVKITQEDGVWIHSSSKKIDGNHIGVAEFEATYTFLNEVVANDITWWEIDFSPDLHYHGKDYTSGWIVAVDDDKSKNAEKKKNGPRS